MADSVKCHWKLLETMTTTAGVFDRTSRILMIPSKLMTGPMWSCEVPTHMPDVVTASEDYASRFYGATGAWFLKVQQDAVCDVIAADRSISILDVGGGHIQIAAPLAEKGYRVTVQGSALECRDRMDANPITRDCEFIMSPVTKLPVADRGYHTVLSFRLLAHYEDWPALVKELCRVADVAIIVDFPSTSALNVFGPLLFRVKKRIEKNTRHWQSFRQADIINAFRQHGFRMEARFKEFFLPMVFYRVLRSRAVTVALEGTYRAVGLTRLFGSPVVLKLVRIDESKSSV